MTKGTKPMTAMYTEEQVLMLEKGTVACNDFENLLGYYADGDLPKTMQALMDDHDCRCHACAESKRTYLLTIKVASALRLDARLPGGVAERLREKLNERLGLNLSVPIPQHVN